MRKWLKICSFLFLKKDKSMKNILFDLDGTLINTGEGIISSIKKTASDMGLPSFSYEVLSAFIGPPLKDSFISVYKMEPDRAMEAVKIFREHYSREDMLLCSPYEGIRELLEDLTAKGCRLFVATSKPTPFAVKILDFFGFSRFFEETAGSCLDNTRSKKAEVISYLMEKYSLNADDTFMVGDKAQDLIGASACNIKGIGVSFGFGTMEELEGEPHLYIASSPEDLLRFFDELS